MGEDIYTEVPRLSKTLLVLPYNQAPVERVFSIVNKIDPISTLTVCPLSSII